MSSIEIHAVRTGSGNQPAVRRIIEELTQTFLPGTPVIITAADGGVAVWGGNPAATPLIAGLSLETASSLAATGVAKTLTFGKVPNEAAAVNIPRGAPLNDGRVGFEVANSDSVFKGQVGPIQTTAVTDVGLVYGLTLDADGHWYVDKTKVTINVDACVKVVGLDQFDTTRGVFFQVVPSQQAGVV